MKKQLWIALCVLLLAAQWSAASTVAYWRFEEGPENDSPVTKPFGALDSSGNDYHLDPWTAGDWAGFVYKTDVAASGVSGTINNFSVKNSGGYPAMATDSAAAIRTITPAAFTIEATFKLENTGGRHATIVGRDSRGSVTTGNLDLAALYFQATPNNGLAIKFCDVSGYWHEAVTATNAFTGFDFGSNPDALNTPWYSMAAVSDGSTLTLYLRNVTEGGDWEVIAQTLNIDSVSPNTALTAGAGDAGDWDAGNWTVGRGLYAGGHGDRAYGFIDEVRISDAALSPSEFLYVYPAGAHNPTPEDGQTNYGETPDGVSVTAELSWSTGKGPSSAELFNPAILVHSLYMSADQNVTSDPNLFWTADIPVTDDSAEYTVTGLNLDGQYLWRVDQGIDDGSGVAYPKGDPNNITGPVWSFGAKTAVPVITKQPVSILADAGQTVEFVVEAQSVSPETYQWYKSADGTRDPDNDQAIGAAGSTGTLSLVNVQVGDEGYYYCVVTNPNPVASAVVTLGIRRKVAHWTLDEADYSGGQYQDVSMNGRHADPNGTPVFVAGQVNEGVQIPGTQSWANAGTWNPSAFSGQLSVSFWTKWDGVNGTWQTFLAKRTGGFNNENVLWQVCTDNNQPHLWLQSPRSLIAVNNGLVAGQWMHIAATYDGTDGTVYINGEQRNKAGFQYGDGIAQPIMLGVANPDAGSPMNGVLDDVRIFNYALSEMDVAQMFVADADEGKTACIQSLRPDAAYDRNGDCIVDLADFAIFAAQWLECGLVPDCLP